MAPLYERIRKLCGSSPAANMVKSYSLNPLWTMITAIFQEKSNTYFILEPIISHFVSSFIDSLSFGNKRCNISQGFGAFFVQSCDRFLFSCYLFSHFFSFFVNFVTIIVVEFILKLTILSLQKKAILRVRPRHYFCHSLLSVWLIWIVSSMCSLVLFIG